MLRHFSKTILLSALICGAAGCGASQQARLVEANLAAPSEIKAVKAHPLASQMPVPAAYDISTQNKMQSAHHWDLLAADVAENIARAKERQEALRDIPVRVALSDATPFERGFRELLLTQLFRKGVPLSHENNEALYLEFDLDLITHARKRLIRTTSGTYESLAPGFYVKRIFGKTPELETQLLEENVKNALVLVEAGELTIELPRNEIVVSTSLIQGDRIVDRTSSIFYINDDEWQLYSVDAGTPAPGLTRITLTKS